MSTSTKAPRLKRELGVFGAMMMGLGAIVGTGVFVSIGIAAGVAGPLVLIAIALAAIVATCNGLSSAQLAANHPVSGGTYEYGYEFLSPSLGFTAGWMFLAAKSASAIGAAGSSATSASASSSTACSASAGAAASSAGAAGSGAALPQATRTRLMSRVRVMSRVFCFFIILLV